MESSNIMYTLGTYYPEGLDFSLPYGVLEFYQRGVSAATNLRKERFEDLKRKYEMALKLAKTTV